MGEDDEDGAAVNEAIAAQPCSWDFPFTRAETELRACQLHAQDRHSDMRMIERLRLERQLQRTTEDQQDEEDEDTAAEYPPTASSPPCLSWDYPLTEAEKRARTRETHAQLEASHIKTIQGLLRQLAKKRRNLLIAAEACEVWDRVLSCRQDGHYPGFAIGGSANPTPRISKVQFARMVRYDGPHGKRFPICAVCHESLGDFWVQVPCNHEFHTKCLLAWSCYSTSCPCCRSPLLGVTPSSPHPSQQQDPREQQPSPTVAPAWGDVVAERQVVDFGARQTAGRLPEQL